MTVQHLLEFGSPPNFHGAYDISLNSHCHTFGHQHRSGTACCSDSRAGAALPGLKAHPLVSVRAIGAKGQYQPVLKGPARAATLQDPLTPLVLPSGVKGFLFVFFLVHFFGSVYCLYIIYNNRFFNTCFSDTIIYLYYTHIKHI